MSLSRHFIVICRQRRNVVKHIRGYLAELNDPSGTDTFTAASPPPAISYRGDERGGWQQPIISAPIPALGGERLCMWGIWGSQTTAATRSEFAAKVVAFPSLVRVYAQAGSGNVESDWQETESLDAHRAAAFADVGWIDDTP